MRARAAVLALAGGLMLAQGGAAQRATFANFGQNEGLGNLAISGLAQDRAGYLWIATEDGLYRYGAGQFRRFGRADGIGNGFNYSVHVDAAGRIWAGTDDGLFEGGDQGPFQLVGENGRSFPVNSNSAFADLPNGNLLVVAQWRLLEVEPAPGGGFAAHDFLAARGVAARGYVGGVIVRRDGSIWFGCGTGLCELRGRALTRWGPAQGVIAGYWRQFFEGGDGTLWLRSREHILALPPGAGRFEARERGLPRQRANDAYWVMVEDGQHRILTPIGGGLARYDRGRWTMLGRAQGLSAFPPSALLFDRRGGLWLGIVGHGLSHWLGYGNFSAWTTDEGLASPVVWSVLQTDPHTVWIATELGLDRLDPVSGRITHWTARMGAAAESLHYIRRGGAGRIWLVNALGTVTVYDPARDRFTAMGRLGGRIINVSSDSRGRVWLATNQGLWNAGAGRGLQTIADAAFGTKIFYTVAEGADGDLWLGARTGLFHNTGAGWHKVDMGSHGPDPRFENISPMPDGSLWVSDYTRGIDHLWIQNDRLQRWQGVDTPTLGSEQNVFLGADRRGWLWAGSDHGVDVYDGRVWRRVTSDNGLLWNDLDDHAFDAAGDGSIWIGTSAGLTHIAQPGAVFAPFTLRLAITSEQRRPFAATFAALGAPSARSLQYRYRLVGAEREWTTSAVAAARYPGLGPGHYTFEVQAEDAAQHVTSNLVRVAFAVAPPWWRTWPLEALGAALAALGLFGLGRWRERNLVARQRELEALVAERTREIENLAAHDGLTQVWNRGAIFDRLSQELDRCAREGGRLAVVLADLDHFKAINDRLGHRRGDAALQHAAQRFLAGLRPYDAVGRYGGEEFLLLLPGLERREGAERLEALRASFAREPLLQDGVAIPLTCSFGVAWVEGTADMEAVLEQADRALYAAKTAGRNRVVEA